MLLETGINFLTNSYNLINTCIEWSTWKVEEKKKSHSTHSEDLGVIWGLPIVPFYFIFSFKR